MECRSLSAGSGTHLLQWALFTTVDSTTAGWLASSNAGQLVSRTGIHALVPLALVPGPWCHGHGARPMVQWATRPEATVLDGLFGQGAAKSNAAILEKEREENEILQRIEINKQYRLAITEDESNKKRNVNCWLQIAIFYIYMYVLGAPDRCAWKDTDGTIHTIRRALYLPEGKWNVVA